MQLIFAAIVLFADSTLQAQVEFPTNPGNPGEPEIYCPKYYKCDRQYTPFLAHNRCRCQVFTNPCHLEVNNVNYGPEYSEVSKINLQYCSCYATPKWLEKPRSDRCAYNNIICLVPVNCVDEGYKPVTASNGCECKVFRNRCDMEHFNCAFMNSNGGFSEIDSESCDCKYSPPIIKIDEPISIE